MKPNLTANAHDSITHVSNQTLTLEHKKGMYQPLILEERE